MEDNRVECPNWWEVILWLFTSMAKNVNLRLRKQIQVVVRVGLEFWDPPITSPVLLLLGHTASLQKK